MHSRTGRPGRRAPFFACWLTRRAARRDAPSSRRRLPPAAAGRSNARAPQVVELTSANWDAVASSGRPVFVEFYATWCPYCNAMKPAWEALAAEANAAGAVRCGNGLGLASGKGCAP